VPSQTQPIPVLGVFTYRLQFPTQACTGTTHTSARTADRWACTDRSSWTPPTRLLAAGQPGDPARPRRHPDHRGWSSGVPPLRADAHHDGPLRHRPARQPRTQPSFAVACGEVVRL
jgi:hypothetical protein